MAQPRPSTNHRRVSLPGMAQRQWLSLAEKEPPYPAPFSSGSIIKRSIKARVGGYVVGWERRRFLRKWVTKKRTLDPERAIRAMSEILQGPLTQRAYDPALSIRQTSFLDFPWFSLTAPLKQAFSMSLAQLPFLAPLLALAPVSRLISLVGSPALSTTQSGPR